MWPALRLVVERIATLEEIETHYSLMDVIMINEAFDAHRQARFEAEQRDR